MRFTCGFLLALAASAFAAPLDNANKDGNCQGLGANGATIDSGYVSFLCQDGKLYPKGCVTRERKRVDIGSTADYRQSRVSCDMAGGPLPVLTVKSCVQNGKEQAFGSTFNDDTTLYTCEKGTDEAKVTQIGCADSGKQVKYNEKVNKDDGVYVCDESSRRLVKTGCVQNGRQYSMGDSYDEGDAWFNCSATGPKIAGCINSGKRLNYGDRYYVNDIFYECYVENNKPTPRLGGCVQRDGSNHIERQLDCFWTEGTDAFQYEYTCKADADGKTAKKIPFRCNYRVSKGVYSIDPGCYRVIEKSAFGCVKNGEALNMQSFQGDDAEKSAANAGLHAC